MSMTTGRARATFPKQVHGGRPETSTTEPGSRQAESGLMDPGKSGSNTHALFNRGTHVPAIGRDSLSSMGHEILK